MNLPRDITRCRGTASVDRPACAERDRCQRYLALRQDEAAGGFSASWVCRMDGAGAPCRFRLAPVAPEVQAVPT